MKSIMVRNTARMLKALVIVSTFQVIANEDAATGVYIGTVKAVQFENDGSFLIQLNLDSQKTSSQAEKCKNQTTFLVQQNYEGVNPRALKRMKKDIREAFFSEKKPSVSLQVYGCHKDKDFPLVNNVMLGNWQDIK